MKGGGELQRAKPMPTSQLPGPIAVIDVETTGLFPLRHDRVIEIAAVVVDGDGRIVRQFVSLLNPGRDIGPSSIHGLTSEDILHTPQFGEIAGLLVETPARDYRHRRSQCAFRSPVHRKRIPTS